MLVTLLLFACSSPEVTGDDGLVGRITDAQGAPVPDLRISSVEGDARTDRDGRFAVEWRAPEQHVRFKWGPLSVTRGYQPADAGRVVELQLPPTRSARVTCPPTPCALTATWSLPDGFEATFRTRCKVAGASLDVDGLPVGPPEMTCSVGHGASAHLLPLTASDTGDVLGFRPARVEVSIQVRQPKGSHVPCEASLNGVPAVEREGRYLVESGEAGFAKASCGGWPARPAWVDPMVRDKVLLAWEPEGATVVAPGGTVDLVYEPEDGRGWSLSLPEVDGVRHLPPLPSGPYRLVHLPPGTAEALAAPPPGGRPGEIVWRRLDDGSRVGRLIVDTPLPKGTILRGEESG